jgi:hypothetical protein
MAWSESQTGVTGAPASADRIAPGVKLQSSEQLAAASQ